MVIPIIGIKIMKNYSCLLLNWLRTRVFEYIVSNFLLKNKKKTKKKNNENSLAPNASVPEMGLKMTSGSLIYFHVYGLRNGP